jgi:hypothetical protein
MKADFAQDTGWQGSPNGRSDGIVLRSDQTHGFGGTHDEGVLIESSAAMAVGVRQTGAADGACGNPDQVGSFVST